MRPPPERRLDLLVQEEVLAVCRLDRDEGVPAWALLGGFSSITRTADELSIVCPVSEVPEGVKAEKGWRVLRVAGVLDFSLVGVLACLTVPLAEAGIGLFAISTFDTDYLLVKEDDLGREIGALKSAGHAVHGPIDDDAGV